MLTTFNSTSHYSNNRLPEKLHYINETAAYSLKPLDLSRSDILLVGEGNCTFTYDLVTQHESQKGENNFGARVLCTDLMSHLKMQKIPDVANRMKALTKLGVQIAFNVDATQLGSIFSGHRFRRIQFNCPHDGSNYYNIPRTLPQIITGYFKSAEALQEEGDTVHLTIFQPPNKEVLYQYHFDLVNAVEGSGVSCEAVIPFDTIRYPHYEHKRTKYQAGGAVNAEYNREFVFQRGPPNTTTPKERIDFGYPILEGGPNANSTVLTHYYKLPLSEKKSFTTLPPMENVNDIYEADCKKIDNTAHLMN